MKSQLRAYSDVFSKSSDMVNSSIQDAGRQQLNAIDAASREQAGAIGEAAELVVGTLEGGFSDLLAKLTEVNQTIEHVGTKIDQVGTKINQLGTMIDWRLSAMIDQQRISNLLQENIGLLMQIPDVQKERQYLIEQGFKHYKNAILDQDLFQDALENLLEAEKREKTDYVVLHRIGLIYLYGQGVVDLVKAEAYLRKAAKYAVVESNPSALRLVNILAGDVRQPLSEHQLGLESIKTLAAESYFHASIASYAQGRVAETIELSEKAISLSASMLEADFIRAKALVVLGKSDEAANLIEGLVTRGPFYAIKTAADQDLASSQAVRQTLRLLRDRLVAEAREQISDVKMMLSKTTKSPQLLVVSKRFLNAIPSWMLGLPSRS